MTEILLALETGNPVLFYNAIVLHLCSLKEHCSAKYSSSSAQSDRFNNQITS